MDLASLVHDDAEIDDLVTTAWLAAGASHHTAMSNQINTTVVREFATMTGVELVVIDEHTTIESAERDLRLNRISLR